MSKNPVMLVDDDEAIREMVTIALTDEGYNVICAVDGSDALDQLRSVQPALILLDVRMPNMDGPTFLRTYREQFHTQSPVIAFTTGRNIENFSQEIGADGYLAKPFDLDDLVSIVSRYVQKP